MCRGRVTKWPASRQWSGPPWLCNQSSCENYFPRPHPLACGLRASHYALLTLGFRPLSCTNFWLSDINIYRNSCSNQSTVAKDFSSILIGLRSHSNFSFNLHRFQPWLFNPVSIFRFRGCWNAPRSPVSCREEGGMPWIFTHKHNLIPWQGRDWGEKNRVGEKKAKLSSGWSSSQKLHQAECHLEFMTLSSREEAWVNG